MLSEGINVKYGITRVSILFFRFQERTLTAMLELNDLGRNQLHIHIPMATLEALAPLHLILASSNRP